MGQTVSARLFTACEAGQAQSRSSASPAQNLACVEPPPPPPLPGEIQTVAEILDSGVHVDGQWTDGSTGLHVRIL